MEIFRRVELCRGPKQFWTAKWIAGAAGKLGNIHHSLTRGWSEVICRPRGMRKPDHNLSVLLSERGILLPLHSHRHESDTEETHRVDVHVQNRTWIRLDVKVMISRGHLPKRPLTRFSTAIYLSAIILQPLSTPPLLSVGHPQGPPSVDQPPPRWKSAMTLPTDHVDLGVGWAQRIRSTRTRTQPRMVQDFVLGEDLLYLFLKCISFPCNEHWRHRGC